jgi:RimJ/RimL family protein N-acetyltransferase
VSAVADGLAPDAPDAHRAPAVPWPLLTARLRLRAMQPGDAPVLCAVRNDPEVARWQGFAPMDDAAARDFVAEMAALAVGPFPVPGQWLQLAIAARDDDRMLGDIGLLPVPGGACAAGCVEIGITLAPQAQGRGLATEALAALGPALASLGLRRMRAVTDARNLRSRWLLQRAGFACLGEQPAEFRGEPCVELVFERGV